MRSPPRRKAMPRKSNNLPFADITVVLGVTASIAAYKAAELVSRLKQGGSKIHVILTPDACQFVRPLTFETISGNPVYSEMFPNSREFMPIHISLAQIADLIVVAPATADFIGKVSAGLASDLLSAVVMATRAPVLIAPAMNANMYHNEIVQENIKRLKKHGYLFEGPEDGYLACGYEGSGRLASTGAILKRIRVLLSGPAR